MNADNINYCIYTGNAENWFRVGKKIKLMIKLKLIVSLTVLCSCVGINVFSQKKVKVKEEEVKPICEVTPLKNRIRMSVVRFNITTNGSGKSKATGNENYNTNWYYNQSNSQTNPEASMNELGANMSTMLQTALQQTNCFNVLLNLDNKKDLDKEIEFGKTDAADKKTAIPTGNMQSAQIVVTGEVTEFNNQSSGQTIGILKTSKQTVRLGFIVTITIPETREVLDSKSFNVEGTSSKKVSLGMGVPSPFGNQRLDFSGGNKYTPAVADALEQGIIKASEWLSSRKGIMILPEINANKPPGLERIVIIVANTDYNKSKEFNEMLKGNAAVKNVEPNFENGTSTITLDYDGKTEKLLDEIMAGKLGAMLNVATQKAGVIKMTYK